MLKNNLNLQIQEIQEYVWYKLSISILFVKCICRKKNVQTGRIYTICNIARLKIEEMSSTTTSVMLLVSQKRVQPFAQYLHNVQ